MNVRSGRRNITLFILPQAAANKLTGQDSTTASRSDLNLRNSGVTLVDDKSIVQATLFQAASASMDPAGYDAKKSRIVDGFKRRIDDTGKTFVRTDFCDINSETVRFETTSIRGAGGLDWLSRETALRRAAAGSCMKGNTISQTLEGGVKSEEVPKAAAQIGRIGSLSFQNLPNLTVDKLSHRSPATVVMPGGVGMSRAKPTDKNGALIQAMKNNAAGGGVTAGSSARTGSAFVRNVVRGNVSTAGNVTDKDQQSSSAGGSAAANFSRLELRKIRKTAELMLRLHPLIDHDYCEFATFNAEIQSSIITTTEGSARTERRYVKKSRGMSSATVPGVPAVGGVKPRTKALRAVPAGTAVSVVPTVAVIDSRSRPTVVSGGVVDRRTVTSVTVTSVEQRSRSLSRPLVIIVTFF